MKRRAVFRTGFRAPSYGSGALAGSMTCDRLGEVAGNALVYRGREGDPPPPVCVKVGGTHPDYLCEYVRVTRPGLPHSGAGYNIRPLRGIRGAPGK